MGKQLSTPEHSRVQGIDYAQDFFTDPQLVDGQPLMTTKSRETAHAYIQEQIKAHESIIRYYKGRHNALTITCRVPPEILASIFQDVLRPADTSLEDYQRISKIRNVSHVCSHWRHVALSTPDLWTNILLFPKKWAEEMVLRSKMAPLTVTGSLDTPSSAILRGILRNHLSHIKDLVLDDKSYFEGSRSDARSSVLTLLNHAAPVMEHLEIRFTNLNVTLLTDWQTNSGDHPKLPDGIVIGSPKLKVLKLMGCGLSWELASFKNLKCLNICDIPPTLRPSITQFLGVLSQTPLLETLRITNIQHSTDGETVSHQGIDHDAIKLTSLQNIEIACPLSIAASLFDHLVLSNNMSSITVKVDMEPGDLDESSIPTLRRMVQHLKDHLEGDIVKLALGPGIQIWTSKTPQSTFGSPTIDIHSNQHAHLFSDEFDGSALPSLGLDKLRSFAVNETSLPAGTWSLVGDLPMLEDLCVDYTNTTHLLNVLRRGIAATKKKKAKNKFSCADPSFPNLRTFTISEWDLDDLDGTNRTLAAQMAECFRLRKQIGLRLKELELDNCSYVSSDNLESFEKNIDVVQWDGTGDPDEYEYEYDLYDEYGQPDSDVYDPYSSDYGDW